MRRRDLIPLAAVGALALIVGIGIARTPRPSAPVPRIDTSGSAAGVRLDSRRSATPRAFSVDRPSDDQPPARDDVLIRAQIRDGERTTYLEASLMEENRLLTRWPDRRMNALRIWIDRHPDIPEWDPAYYVAAARAFEEWKLAGFPVAMDVVIDSSNTDIRIRWVKQFASSEGDAIGMTRKRRDRHGWMVSAEITIATHDQGGRPLPPHTIFGVARHEAGHALGLGHSPNPNDVMFPFSRATVISAADRATLHLLYKIPPGVVK